MTIEPTMPLLPPSLAAARTPEAGPKDAAQVREVARDLEALLVSQLIAAMRRTVPESGMLQSSASRRVLDDAFDHELARALTANGSLGFAKQIEAQLLARGASVPSPSALRESGAVASTTAQAAEPTAVPAGERASHAAQAVVAPVDLAEPAPARQAEPAAVVVPGEHAVALASRVGATGTMQLPVDAPRVTSGFGTRVDPITGANRFHGGVDLGAPTGTPIRAAADGDVVFSGRRGPAGNVVEVRHGDGLVTRYAHADRTLVSAGQKVVAGDVIATVGSTGRSTGPHLHFTVERNGQVVDPAGVFPDLQPREQAG